jgi:hypothetical protein
VVWDSYPLYANYYSSDVAVVLGIFYPSVYSHKATLSHLHTQSRGLPRFTLKTKTLGTRTYIPWDINVMCFFITRKKMKRYLGPGCAKNPVFGLLKDHLRPVILEACHGGSRQAWPVKNLSVDQSTKQRHRYIDR